MGQKNGKPNVTPNNDQTMLYSSNNKRVTLDDFELLQVLGKGNFAKVIHIIMMYLCSGNSS